MGLAGSVDGVDAGGLQRRLEAVQQQVADAARAAGREPADITTVVVTKFQPIRLIGELAALGVTDFGESRHPEARDKAAALPNPTWHFIGQLQTNKAKAVAAYAATVHSVDRTSLIDALGAGAASAGRTLDVFLQVDLGAGETAGRGGAAPAEVESLAERILATESLTLAGVMAVAPQHDDPAAAFARLRNISAGVVRIAPRATAISAGMSGDFAAAIREGATHLRIGSAITGPRPSGP